MPEKSWDAHMGASYLLQTAAELMRDYDFDLEARQLASGAGLAFGVGNYADTETAFREALARVLQWNSDQIEAAVVEVRGMIVRFRSTHESSKGAPAKKRHYGDHYPGCGHERTLGGS
jgi:hypothetical protein